MLDDEREIHALFAGAPKTTEFKKLRKRIVRNTREAIEQYGMVDAQGRKARWLVCLSGGKDSYTLLAVLYELKWRGLLPVDILACNLDRHSARCVRGCEAETCTGSRAKKDVRRLFWAIIGTTFWKPSL